MIQTQEEQISYSDNSHLFGVPFLIREELHATIPCKREDLRKMVEKIIEYPEIDFHVAFEEPIAPNDSEVRQ